MSLNAIFDPMVRAFFDDESGSSGGGLPVVELTTVPTEKGTTLTEEESAMLTAAAEKRLPALLRFSFNDNLMTVVASLAEFEGGCGYVYVMGIRSIQFFNECGTWSAYIMAE